MREMRLLAGHQRRWLDGLRPLLRSWTYRRGFIEAATMEIDEFLVDGKRLFEREPARRLRLPYVGSGRALARSPLVARLAELNLSRAFLVSEDEKLVELAASPHLSSLQVLKLCGNGLSDVGALALARSEHLSSLELLDLTGNDRITEKGRAVLYERFGPGVRFGDEL